MENPFSSIVNQKQDLKKIKFATQKGNEELKLLLRRHFITNTGWILRTTLFTLLPILIWIFHTRIFRFLVLDELFSQIEPFEWIAAITVYYLTVYFYAFMRFLAWFFNVLIVTNRRIIDINYTPPFYRQTTQTQLEEVQDVHHRQGGTFGIIFNYGDIFIQTAGTQQNISIERIPQPNQVHNLIVQTLP